ncbi:MAG TPA: ABC transporter permease, partial [Methylomirabilota bacterium]|nr:ABC transporter permease [Methylomirabilota bacterium]
MGSIIQDVRYGLRMLGKNPGFAAVAVLTIAIGIGASTTIFSWIRSVILNPLPGAAEPHRVMALETLAPSGEPFLNSYLDYVDFRDNLKQVESLTVEQPVPVAMGNDDRAERVWAELVSGNFFDLLRVQPR